MSESLMLPFLARVSGDPFAEFTHSALADQNGPRPPRKHRQSDFILAGSGSKAESSHHSRKGPGHGGNNLQVQFPVQR